MYAHNNNFRSRGGGRGHPPAQPPGQPPVSTINPNFTLQNPNIYHPDPNLQFLQNTALANLALQSQIPNFAFQNPNLSMPNPNLQFRNQSFLPPPPQQQVPTPNYHQPQPQTQSFSQNPRQGTGRNPRESLEKVDKAVIKARRELLAAGEHVSAWKVAQNALLALKIDSWSSLGFRMQEIPSLYGLMFTEGKINAFIHCFVGVRSVASLFDLEVAVCKNEGVKQFEELELGPLLLHPLVLHYFSVKSDDTEVFKISSEEIVSCLCEFMDTHKKKEIKTDEFLEFVAKKRSVLSKEKLGVRIQSLGMHISFIQEARRLEHAPLKKYIKGLLKKSNKKCRKRPLFSSQKQLLDERFHAISDRIRSFGSMHNDFCGKHIRFSSSSSGDEDSDDCTYVDEKNDNDHLKLPVQNINGFERVSSCPYPSAIEEATRLGLKGVMDGHPSASGRLSHNESILSFKKKRKYENRSCSNSAPSKLHKTDDDKTKGESNLNETYTLSNNSMRMFITTWKDACSEHTVAEVLERMLEYYKPIDHREAARLRKRANSMFTLNPFVGLLNVAVTSIKCGMWDSIYDSLQAISPHELIDTDSHEHSEYETIDIEPSGKNVPATTGHFVQQMQDLTGVTVEEVLSKIRTYFDLDDESESHGKSRLENKFFIWRKLYNCGCWLAEQFCVKEFNSLGYGEFSMFLEKYASLLPSELQKFLVGDVCKKAPLEVCLLQHLLITLVSQASNSLWENERITKQMIFALLTRQFPLLSFKITENGCMENFLDIVGNADAFSKSVLFSATLLGTFQYGGSLPHDSNCSLETAMVRTSNGQEISTFKSVTSKDATEILRRAPMLSDLNSWSHWDLIFAPSLGPLVGWLLNEVNEKELLCLVTKDGKVIRIEHSATLDSFLEAAIQGCAFQTAVNLLSLFALAGGKRHVPLSLLKCHAQHAFEVILKNYLENVKVNSCKDFLLPGKAFCRQQKLATDTCNGELHQNLISISKDLPVVTRFVLDCLGYIPSEFRGFAADILLSGLRSVIKDAPSAILRGCNQTEQRLMLHEVGLSLGVAEWIDDYHAFCSSATVNYSLSMSSEAAGSEFSTGSKCMKNTLDKFSYSEGEEDGHGEDGTEVLNKIDRLEVSIDDGCTEELSEVNENKDSALVIESIRRDEFGLDSNLSTTESSMLKKQHARLGRALHCLSQELYSQDSHFLLELVQNADDNIYSEKVEPTLTFILQESRIIVLNNERGFSAQNIRALCDVGNSTKKGSGIGYIGQKGIGFKSVFRVTDAPEIHSNGFHVKFDISEGQIGFVLPTVVPPCNIELFSRMACRETNQLANNNWNTCIVLPFRSKLLEANAMVNIVKMFSDLHPSLLLFLHRLKCIIFRNMIDDSFMVMRKEIVGDGIIKVSSGKHKMTWFVASQELRADVIRRDVQTTEISIAFTLQESNKGGYTPQLVQQPVFAFLPLRTYGLKFIIQGDFVLPSSREEVDGDSPWNEWILTEIPGLFVGAERSFCALPCFRDSPGKAVAAYMSFVPLVGEVHGFFSSLPHSIVTKLRMSNCLLLEGDNNQWVPPCKVLRGWNKQARFLLPDDLLLNHLGLGFLDKDIIFSDSLARALGIAEYGPKVLLQILTSLCHLENGLNSMGLCWLSSWLNELYTISFHTSGRTSLHSGIETDIRDNLKKIPFIPLSDGTYSSVDEGTIWLHSDASSTGSDNEYGLKAFPKLSAKLRTVNHALLSVSAADISFMDPASVYNITRMLHIIGVQQLSAHEIIKLHILPAISGVSITNEDKNLMADYLSFVRIHLQSSCSDCRVEGEFIISELRNKAFILTNHGFKRPVETSIHFSKEFGNPVSISKLINNVDIIWHEVDIIYLKHPTTESFSCGLMNWRKFLQEIGITDFVQIVQVDKSIADIFHTISESAMLERDLIFSGLVAKDWESYELVHLLSVVSTSGNLESCKYLLEVLDSLWDDCFCDKATGYCNFSSSGDSRPFKSSFMRSICGVQWVASSMDDKLYYPKDLFHDCDAVRSILGAAAPYAVPKVKSGKFLSDIGFKTDVSLDDVLEIFKLWRRSETPFRASVAQMSKFYTFIWDKITSSNQKIAEEFHSGPFIFVPYASASRHENAVSGLFLSPEEVYWHDSTGLEDQLKEIISQDSSMRMNQGPLSKKLCNVYPGLHDFFVNEWGVCETPSFCIYLQILLQMSTVALPSQATNAVFQVFLKWTDGLNSGLLSSEDIIHLKECLKKLEYTVLPTVQDKWVSLHPSFGLVCWCDDKKLGKRFKQLHNVDFLDFGKLSDEDQEILRTKVSSLMQTLGIPALSEVVTREAVYYGSTDGSYKASLVNWALPYAQRYMYSVHHDKYIKFKQSGLDNLNSLQIVVVEKLYYKNVIKHCGVASKKEIECSCLLQGSILYTTAEPNSHAIFMELSRLFFDGSPELHMANFLHMITTMAESGSTEEQTEFFILNSQKVFKLPAEEPVWSLPSVHLFTENDRLLQKNITSEGINKHNPLKSKKKAGTNLNWPPSNWKTAPGFNYAHSNCSRTQAAITRDFERKKGDDTKANDAHQHNVPIKIDDNWTITENSVTASLPEPDDLGDEFGHAGHPADSSINIVIDRVDLDLVSDGPDMGSSAFSKREQLYTGAPNANQALLTGRLGELVAFKHFTENLAMTDVKWVNEVNETGLPYDIVIGERGNPKEYIEVKATKSARKDWFKITMREWQFAVEKGESFSVAHVLLLSNNGAKVSLYKNPVKLCQQGQLQLVLMMAKEEKNFLVC
ncbi:DUF3883 domain-containing protein [Cephalotus follicularis]|uniref:DUF3883 domain-containing protein n=1 Tax=Cephalotus follicularis TaxID=3775 RepID=A0A1Q3BDS5_CEPFO|nr:DUF3883 domain-containing protein [Cephalotus follicularis]